MIQINKQVELAAYVKQAVRIMAAEAMNTMMVARIKFSNDDTDDNQNGSGNIMPIAFHPE